MSNDDDSVQSTDINFLSPGQNESTSRNSSKQTIESVSESRNRDPCNKSIYQVDSDVFVHSAGIDQKARRYTIKRCFEGLEGRGFTSAVVLLVESNGETHEETVLKIFDHTVDTNLRRCFIGKTSSTSINRILEQAFQDKSLMQLWSKFCEIIDLGYVQDERTRRLLGLESCPTLVSYGELVCRYLIISREDESLELQRKLVASGIVSELTTEYRTMCYFLWLRVMFHAELSAARGLPSQTILPRFKSCALITAEDNIYTQKPSTLYQHPAILLEYVQGTSLTAIERVFKHDFERNPSAYYQSIARVLPRPKEDVERNSSTYDQLLARNLPRSEEDVENILMTILASRHRLLDMGFFYQDFHSGQVVIQREDQGLLRVRLVDYGALESVFGPDHEMLSAWHFDATTLNSEVLDDHWSYHTINLSLMTDIEEMWEYVITAYFDRCCAAFAKAQILFRDCVEMRFQYFQSVSTTICVRLIIEDIRSGAAAAGCDDIAIMLATGAVGRVLKSDLDAPLEVRVRKAYRLFAATTTEDLELSFGDSVSEFRRQVDSSVKCYQSMIKTDTTLSENEKQALSESGPYVPHLFVLRWRAEQQLKHLIPQSCWKAWEYSAQSAEVSYSIVQRRLDARVKAIETGAVSVEDN